MKPLKYLAPSLYVLNLLIIVGLWVPGATVLAGTGPAGWFVLAGRMAGLLAFYSALWQLLLIGRIGWIEGAYGHDRLSRWHHANARILISILAFHPVLLTLGYAIHNRVGVIDQFVTFVLQYPQVVWALVAYLMFMTIFGLSINIVRRRLPHEWWYAIHFLLYGAIVLSFLHQGDVGGDIIEKLPHLYWQSLTLAVALNVLWYRFGRPSWRSWRHGYEVSRVVAENDNVTSVYISGRHLDRLRVRPGQFVMARFLAQPWVWQSHPFSLSQAPNDHELRLTIKNIGDFTSTVRDIPVGTHLLMEGPLGIFTSQLMTRPKALLIAGGIGITPLRALFEELSHGKAAVDLMYCAHSQADFVLSEELNHLATERAQVHYLPEEAMGRVSAELIKRYAPDVAQRDIFLCGPPPMMDAAIALLTELEVPLDQIHYEKFRLG